ncbi:uncharacterized protein EKO05_0008227 [Ascochyta rabiei]|uniref:Uncharacterized protein n=1 Tax=Didymella rabiei TaxID=5454 RepID=A0A163DJ18_DIDRA|nr:uncharacterized protein EKO05_0008227 [Ascochyta rabiei]KZM23185.1 hypothetical protein ST47_g5804 [Ascochyta rabiei]UPX17900.1 hypothetical protein EKO05_0008227 [Ascochyta rabiei]
MSKVNPLDVLAIKNVISRYCESLDAKDFALLDKVFVQDVSADYPFNSDLQGVEAVARAIRNRLGPVRTHHNLTTQRIVFDKTGRTAHAITYFQGAHFGRGLHEGKLLCAYGRYIDDMVLQEASNGDCEGVPGASGIWRIKQRKVAFTQRIGDEKIMSEH